MKGEKKLRLEPLSCMTSWEKLPVDLWEKVIFIPPLGKQKMKELGNIIANLEICFIQK